MTIDIESTISSTAGRALYRLLPELYRVRDEGDLAKYLDACGVLLDQLRQTIDQLLADQAPETDPDRAEAASLQSQTWVLPYLADLFDVRVISPHTAGRRLEIDNAIRWRQRSGTLRTVDEIAEAFVTQQMQTEEDTGQGDVEVQEGIARLTVTPRVDMTARSGDAEPPETLSPDGVATPWVTPDTRAHSRALRVPAGTAGAREGVFAGEDIYWMSTHPAGAPCFPGTYQDRTRLTPDMRTPSWRQGLAHPKRVLLHIPPRAGFFSEGWEDDDGVVSNLEVDASSGDQTISGRIVTGTLTVTGGNVAVEESAVSALVVQQGASVKASDSLFGSIAAADGIELHACTVLGDVSARQVTATDCLFIGRVDLQYPPDQLHELLGHTSWVNAVAVTTDGTRAVSGSSDRSLIVWDLEAGVALHTLTGHSRPVRSVDISPDGSKAVSGSADRRVRIWDIATGASIHVLTGHGATVSQVRFTPDGRRVVSAARDNTARVWDVSTGVLIHTLSGHADWVLSIAVSPDGRRAASASRDQTVKVWDLESGAVLHTLSGHSNSVEAVAFSSDGTRIVSGSRDGNVRVWDADTGSPVHTLSAHTGWVTAVAVTGDGKVISGSHDGTARVWDMGAGALIHTLSGHSGFVIAVSPVPDGTRAVTASYDRTLKEWDLSTGEEIHSYSGHTSRIFAAAVASSGEIAVSASTDETVRVWDLKRELARSCIRYSRVSAEALKASSEALQLLPPGSCTSDRPFFIHTLFCPETGEPELREAGFGEAGCAVLHPATPSSVWQGAEDGGEMGCYHHRYYALSWSAAETKLTDHLPLGITPVLIPDHTLARTPPGEAE